MKNKHNHSQYKGYYFVTLTTKDRKDLFGKIVNDKMILSKRGEIAKSNWSGITAKFSEVSLDEFIIMPNHIHAIVIFGKRNRRKSTMEDELNHIIEGFKRCTRLDINQSFKGSKPFDWQSTAEIREVHNEGELFDMRYYIDSNPIRWEMDPENLLRSLKAK